MLFFEEMSEILVVDIKIKKDLLGSEKDKYFPKHEGKKKRSNMT